MAEAGIRFKRPAQQADNTKSVMTELPPVANRVRTGTVVCQCYAMPPKNELS